MFFFHADDWAFQQTADYFNYLINLSYLYSAASIEWYFTMHKNFGNLLSIFNA